MNLKNIPGKEVCGIDTATLNWIVDESSDRYLVEMSTSFLDMLNSEEFDFDETLSADITNELNELEKSCIPQSSQRQTDSVIKRLKTFLKANNLSDDLMTIPPKILNDYLRFFTADYENKMGLSTRHHLLSVYGRLSIDTSCLIDLVSTSLLTMYFVNRTAC